MAHYTLTVRDNFGIQFDHLSGTDSVGDAAALTFGKGVVQNLVLGSAKRYVGWSMDIAQGNRAVGRIPF
jgi:hypothetical protein